MSETVLERVVLPAGHAVRFVDAATGRPVADGLRCRWRPAARRPALGSVVTAGGVHHWPERTDTAPGASPPSPPSPQAELLVEDPLRRFLPLRLAWPPTGRPGRQPVDVLLYDAPGRPAPAGCASVHALLLGADGRPAAWTRLTLTPAGGPARDAMADSAGRLTLHLPAPAPARRVAGSPPGEASPPTDGAVPAALVELAFAHAPGVAAEAAARAAVDADTEAPRLDLWRAQPPCDALAHADGSRLATARLPASAPLVLRTAGLPPGRSELRLVPR